MRHSLRSSKEAYGKSLFFFMTPFSVPDGTIKTTWQICNETLKTCCFEFACFFSVA